MMVSNNFSLISSILFLVFMIWILYIVYTYLYPGADPNYTKFLSGEADARKPVVQIAKSKVPAIYTGGDFTLSFWMYIDDWNYRVNSSKFLFAISPTPTPTGTGFSPLVGLLTPLTNSLMVRAATVPRSSTPTPGSPAPSSNYGPDITIESNLKTLLSGNTNTSMFQTTVDAPCDVKEVPLQRWTCVTIVVSGRVLDVYMDGKLSRSCVLDNVVNVPRGPLQLRLAENGGFGGRYSSIQMWNQQLTPDVIYGIYQMGPTQVQHNIFRDLAKFLNINVTFTGSAPGQPIVGGGDEPACKDPMSVLMNKIQSEYNSMNWADARSFVSDAASSFAPANAQGSMSGF